MWIFHCVSGHPRPICVPKSSRPPSKLTIARALQAKGSRGQQRFPKESEPASVLPMWDKGDLSLETGCLWKTSLQCLQALLQGARDSAASKLEERCHPEEEKGEEGAHEGRDTVVEPASLSNLFLRHEIEKRRRAVWGTAQH